MRTFIVATLLTLATPTASDVVIANEHVAGLSLTTRGEVDLESAIHVERETSPGVFQAVSSGDLRIRASCNDPEPATCVRVRAGTTTHVAPWTGFTCSGQCSASCKGNAYLGPGRFRFVIASCDHTLLWQGPVFDLPPYH